VDVLVNLAHGFAVSLTPVNLLLCLVGAIVGTAIGVLPGLGPTATISLLLPVTLSIDKTGAVIMLAGIYYGAMYGGSITSILVKIPGEAASVITCIDGHEMARKGRAGAALGISAFGSFIAGVIAVIGVAAVGPGLAQHALKFGPTEMTALVVLGLSLVVFISVGSRSKALMSTLLGLLLSTVGIDLVSGTERFAYTVPYLMDSFNIAVMAMGLFGVAEVLLVAEQPDEDAATVEYSSRLRDLLPNREEWRRSIGPIGRGSVLGFLLGLLPGGGALIASFASYVMEKRWSKTPEVFGHGAIEGVAGPESANNSAAQSAFVPLLCLGIPSNAVMGVIMGALLIHGVTPGPKLIVEHPQLFWGVVTSMLIGNLMLVILNVPLVGVFVSLLRIPNAILSPLILLFCVIGAYSLNNNATDVVVMMLFGGLGYGLRKLHFDAAPMLLAFVLGSIFEKSLRQALIIGYGDWLTFVHRPISAAFLAVTLLLVGWPLLRRGWERATRRQGA
jgi:putative tricarboxylic transport membrane protein